MGADLPFSDAARAVLALALFATGAADAQRSAPPPPLQPVFAENFDSADSLDRVRALRSRHVTVVDGRGIGGSRALRVTYVGGAEGSSRIVAKVPIPPALDYTLTYAVRFDRDFQFVLGGKLHGLGSRMPVAGGEPIRPDGWSARVMWREHGRAETYIYHQDQPGRYGDAGTAIRPFRFTRGRYYAVAFHVRLNQPATQANGLVELHIDNHLIERRDGLRLRSVDTPDSLISTFLFSTFHGGNDPSWAPRTKNGGYADVHATFDDFAVYPGPYFSLPAPR